MSLFSPSLQPALDSNGNPIAGAKWYFYLSGTSTPTAVYSASNLTGSLGSTVTADASGRFVPIYFDDTISYRAVLKDALGVTITGPDPAYVIPTTSSIISVKDAPFSAKGDATTDDTAAIQAAINYCITNRIGVLYFPAPLPGDFYKITSPLTVTGATAPLRLMGASTAWTTIIGVGILAGQYIIDFNCSAADNIENISVHNLTLRSLDGVPNGLHLKNVSYADIRGVRFYGLVDGIINEGTRCFTHNYELIQGTSISGRTVAFASGFNGGGQFVFNGCTFVGNIGLQVPTTAALDNLSFVGCNWESCVTRALRIQGTVAGLSIVGSRTERGLSSDFEFRPFGAAEYIGGLNIAGNSFSASDSSASDRILIGGDSGKIRGFSITANVVTHGSDTFGGKLVNLNGDGESGLVAGNFIRGTTGTSAGVINASRAGVVVISNENLSGKLTNYSGLTTTATWDPASVANAAQTTTTVTLTGANVGDPVSVRFSLDLQGLILTAYVSSANTVTVVLANLTGGAINLGSGTLTVAAR
jgi:hypothetical protein